MSTLTKTWTEGMIRYIIRKLDEKTGLNGANLPIKLASHGNVLGYYQYAGKKLFCFNSTYMNDSRTKESEAIDAIRHNYAHFYVDATNLGKYVQHSTRETSHGDHWKWACMMVGADFTRCHDDMPFNGKDLSPDGAMKAYSAADIDRFEILPFLTKWNTIPVDAATASKSIARIKERDMNTYYDVGDKVIHPKRGFGYVKETIPFSYWTQKILVCFEDQTEGVFESNHLCKIVDGLAIPYQVKRR